MKILRVISSVDPVAGGPINGLLNSTAALLSRGHYVTVVTLDSPPSPWVKEFPYDLYTFEPALGTYSYSRRLRCWLESNVRNYDVVVIHGLWQFHSICASQVCVENKVPYVVFTHGMLDPWFNVTDKLKAAKKWMYWLIFERKVINRANAVLFTSEEERILARKSFFPYSPEERVVAYGSSRELDSDIDSSEVFLERYPELRNKKILLFLSRIHGKKGVDLLIDALAKCSDIPDDVFLAIAGPGSEELIEALRGRAKKLGISGRIKWLGMLDGILKWGAYKASDCFILPSHQENFGIVVAEALSSGTPVLVTDKVNIWREILAHEAGYAEDDTVEGVVSLLQSWFRSSDVVQNRMRGNALRCYEKNFSIEAAVESLEYELLRVVDKHGKVEE
jgi:glycosyltransferase involved in cell wall biosynthesis